MTMALKSKELFVISVYSDNVCSVCLFDERHDFMAIMRMVSLSNSIITA